MSGVEMAKGQEEHGPVRLSSVVANFRMVRPDMTRYGSKPRTLFGFPEMQEMGLGSDKKQGEQISPLNQSKPP